MSYNTLQQQTLHYFSRPHWGVPAGPILSPAAWRASDMADRSRWSYSLSAEEIREVDDAVDHAMAKGKTLDALTKEDLPLPLLAPKFCKWQQSLVHGLGVQLIQGVPVERWNQKKAEVFFWCFGQHLGITGAQNRDNDLLGHVRDDGADPDDPSVRQYRTSSHIPFHCDAADVVGLLCLKQAREGGASRLVSSVSVFNDLLAQNAELAPVLFDRFHLDAHHEGGVFTLPVHPCRYFEGELRTFFHTDYFHSASKRYAHAKLSPKQCAAIALYDQLCDSPSLQLDMQLVPGDIQLISNHTVLHSRTGYVDHAAAADKRHLLRLWLSLQEPMTARARLLSGIERGKLLAGVLRERRRYSRQRAA